MAQFTTFKAVARSKGGCEVETECRGFKITMDEPEEMDGTNKGMNPVEALLCSLGACQTIIAHAFAEANGIDLQDFWVDLEGDLDYDGFMHLSDVRPGLLEVRCNLHMKSSSSVEKLNEFAEFIEKTCPVSDSLMNGIKIQAAKVTVEK